MGLLPKISVASDFEPSVIRVDFKMGYARPVACVNNPRSAGACFVAGTLVHTDKGLVPIEKLRVGDKVLAQPEMKGEQAYKRVVNTFEFEDKDVYLLIFGTQDKVDQIVATGNHPFWVKDRGWLQLCDISPGEEFELPDGTFASAYCVERIYQTEKTDIGWVLGKYIRYNDFRGDLVDLRDGRIAFGEEHVPLELVDSAGHLINFKTRVYNIEVEDFHTYYVGQLGAWVRGFIRV